METEYFYFLAVLILLLGTYFYVRRQTSKRMSADFGPDPETHPAFEATQYVKVESRPESFLLVLDPLASKTTKSGRKFLIFSPDEKGIHLVIVSDIKRHHNSLLHNPLAQGLTPLFAYTIHPKKGTVPAGKSISDELLKESVKNLNWFTRTILPKEEFRDFLK
jgi:hypothetical protein